MGSKQYSSPPEMSIDPNLTYSATIKTAGGDIVLRLYADKAPNTVNNFVFLASDGYYDGVIFHRVIEKFHGARPVTRPVPAPEVLVINSKTSFIPIYATTVPVSCRWRMRAPAQMAPSSSSHISKPIGSTISTQSSGTCPRVWKWYLRFRYATRASRAHQQWLLRQSRSQSSDG